MGEEHRAVTDPRIAAHLVRRVMTILLLLYPALEQDPHRIKEHT
jgi:hypothetical protein